MALLNCLCGKGHLAKQCQTILEKSPIVSEAEKCLDLGSGGVHDLGGAFSQVGQVAVNVSLAETPRICASRPEHSPEGESSSRVGCQQDPRLLLRRRGVRNDACEPLPHIRPQVFQILQLRYQCALYLWEPSDQPVVSHRFYQECLDRISCASGHTHIPTNSLVALGVSMQMEVRHGAISSGYGHQLVQPYQQ